MKYSNARHAHIQWTSHTPVNQSDWTQCELNANNTKGSAQVLESRSTDLRGSADQWHQLPNIKTVTCSPPNIWTWWTDHTNVMEEWFPKKVFNNHLHHPKRMILAITIPSSGHIYGYQVIRNSSHQDNQTSIREDGKLHRKHTVPNRRTPIKILIWAVTEIKKIIK